MVHYCKRIVRWMGYGTLTFCCLVTFCTASYGEYPDREIKIFAATAGSVSDLWTRVIANDLSKILKVPVVVANKGGGLSGQIEAKKAKPDGYSLINISLSNVVTSAITANPTVDLVKDFVPIGALGSFPTLIAVEKSSPFKTYEDLIDYAKKNPGKLKCGSAGLLISYFNFELLKRYAQVDVTVVHFKGSSPATAALLGKHVDLLAISPTSLVGLLKAGRVRALLSTQRLKDFPDIPLFSQKGAVEAGMAAWSGLFAPASIPKEVHAKLVDAFGRMAKDTNVIKKIEGLDYAPDYLNATELSVRLKKDYEKISAAAKELGVGE